MDHLLTVLPMIVGLLYRLLGSIWLMITMLLFHVGREAMTLPLIMITSSAEYMCHTLNQLILVLLSLRLAMGEVRHFCNSLYTVSHSVNLRLFTALRMSYIWSFCDWWHVSITSTMITFLENYPSVKKSRSWHCLVWRSLSPVSVLAWYCCTDAWNAVWMWCFAIHDNLEGFYSLVFS